MEYKLALLKFVLFSFLVFQAVTALELTIDSDPEFVYHGTRVKSGVIEIDSIGGKELNRDDLRKYQKRLAQHVGKRIHVGNLIKRLCSVDNQFVAVYENVPVKIQPKFSDQIFSGIYLVDGELQINQIEDSAGTPIETDSNKIAAALATHKDKIIYFTIENEASVLDEASIDDNGKVIVAFSSQPARLYLEPDSELCYFGIRLKSGVIEVTKLENGNGEPVGMTVQEAGNKLMVNKPKYICVTEDRQMRSCDKVSEVGVRSFKVEYSDIPFKFTVGTQGDVYSGFAYTCGSIRIWYKNGEPIAPNYVQIKKELEDAKDANTKIFLNDARFVKKIDKVVGANDYGSMAVYYSLCEVKFFVDPDRTIRFGGNFIIPGLIDVTEVYVNETKSDIKIFYEGLKSNCNGKILHFETADVKKTLIEVGDLVEDTRFTIKCLDMPNTN